jgi:hypothetical protein
LSLFTPLCPTRNVGPKPRGPPAGSRLGRPPQYGPSYPSAPANLSAPFLGGKRKSPVTALAQAVPVHAGDSGCPCCRSLPLPGHQPGGVDSDGMDGDGRTRLFAKAAGQGRVPPRGTGHDATTWPSRPATRVGQACRQKWNQCRP